MEKQRTCAFKASLPPGTIVVLAVQYMPVAIVDLTLAALLVSAMGGSLAQAAWMIRMSFVPLAFGKLLLIPQKGVAAGYLSPHLATVIFKVPFLPATQSGGMA